MSDPTGVAPPLPTLLRSTAVTPTDHGQIVVLVAWLCFTAGILLSLMRLYIRWPLSALAGKDDLTYAISTLFAIIQTAITIHAVTKGFGRTELELSPAQALAAAKVSRFIPPHWRSQHALLSDDEISVFIYASRCLYLHINLIVPNDPFIRMADLSILLISLSTLPISYTSSPSGPASSQYPSSSVA